MTSNHLPAIYHTRYVLYLDILGFREIVNNIEADGVNGRELLDTVLKIINDFILEKEITNNTSEMQGDKPRYTQFSDCLVISTANNAVGLKSILTRVMDLPMRLMQKGVFVRGAVVKGLLLHNRDHLLGSGLIKAYEMESRLAKYPRVLISRDVYDDAATLVEESMSQWLGDICRRDADGLYFVAPFYANTAPSPDPVNSACGWPFAEEHLRIVRSHIEIAFKKHAGNDEICTKYYWLARQLNEIQDIWHKRGTIQNTYKISL